MRLIRHYANLGLLDENAREGREARYGFRHLLQLLLVRRLLTEGYPAAVIAKLITGKGDAELRALLQGGASVTATPANPALDFLAGVRRRAALPARRAVQPPACPSPSLFSCAYACANGGSPGCDANRSLGAAGTPAWPGDSRSRGLPVAFQSARARTTEPAFSRRSPGFEPLLDSTATPPHRQTMKMPTTPSTNAAATPIRLSLIPAVRACGQASRPNSTCSCVSTPRSCPPMSQRIALARRSTLPWCSTVPAPWAGKRWSTPAGRRLRRGPTPGRRPRERRRL